MRCRNWGLVAKNESVSDTHKLSRVRCKQWSCDYCSRRLQARWRTHLQHEIARLGGEWSFITVTASGDSHRAKTTIVDLRTHMDTLLKRLKRSWRGFQYVRFYEQHTSGEYHAHILVSVYPPDTNWRAAWRKVRVKGEWRKVYRGLYHHQLSRHSEAVGLGYVCDVTPLGQVADTGFALIVSYVTKYLTKQGQGYEAPKGMRRIQMSRGFRPMNEHDESDSEWFVDSGGYTVEEFLIRDNNGVTVLDLDRNKAVVLSDYEHGLTYPNKVYDYIHGVIKGKLDETHK